MATLRLPSPIPAGPSPNSNSKSFHPPLTFHGLPKRPRDVSPDRPHRFSTIGLPISSFISPPSSPRSPGPMSPPMSARSFGTFIDSEPTTPAYSPRPENGWDSSTLVLLRPMSSSSAPSSPSPIEPTWDMVTPAAISTKTSKIVSSEANNPAIKRYEMSRKTSLSSHSVEPVKTTTEIKKNRKASDAKSIKEIKVAEVFLRESNSSVDATVDDETNKKPGENQNTNAEAAPFGKLATRMKSLLRRRTTGDKRKEKKEKEPFPEMDRMEDVHWTEM